MVTAQTPLLVSCGLWHTHTHTHTHSLPELIYSWILWACALLLLHISGYAFTASICEQHRSCAIAEHDGLQSGFTLSHLTGLRWLRLYINESMCCFCLHLPFFLCLHFSWVMSLQVLWMWLCIHTIKHVESHICTKLIYSITNFYVVYTSSYCTVHTYNGHIMQILLSSLLHSMYI